MLNYMKFIYLQLFGMIFGMFGLYSLNALNPVNYIVIAFIWLLFSVEYTKPPIVRPQWHQKLRYVIWIGVVIFLYVTLQRIESVFTQPVS